MQFSLKSSARLLAVAAATLLGSACSQDAVSPTAAPTVIASAASSDSRAQGSGKSATNNLRGLFESDVTTGPRVVSVLAFRPGVAFNTRAEKTIGIEGGVLTLPATGFTLIVPPGAVLRPTTFKVRPNDNGLVAYEFEPHGTNFLVPLTYQQDLSKTNFVVGHVLSGGYYLDPLKLDPKSRKGETAEQYTVLLDPLGLLKFTIKHFSGYLVSSA
ncbi:MAG: hypothetical protein U0132_01065 [Gemmatimonadaceae bacterium]